VHSGVNNTLVITVDIKMLTRGGNSKMEDIVEE
jgi:hypothetical protein